MDIGHVLTQTIIGRPDGAAAGITRYCHPSRVQVTDDVVGDYSEFVEHIAQVLRDALIDLPYNDLASLVGAGLVLDERLNGTRRTIGALR
ncbi:hypothetical protein GCM10022419_125850 [Nonomuraea rosea]|uniref:Uncharacterized protein n=1 Tax=Nonomuraea rosea TaxID=638574 RepID=A0ABP6ZUJ3_9ACTN